MSRTVVAQGVDGRQRVRRRRAPLITGAGSAATRVCACFLRVSRRSALASQMPQIDAQLQRMVEAGDIERWLNESEVTYRDMVSLPADAQ